MQIDKCESDEYKKQVLEQFNIFIGEQKITKGWISQSKLVTWNELYGHKLSKQIKFVTVWNDCGWYKLQSNSSTKKIDSLYNLNNSINVIVYISDTHYCLLKNSSKLSINKKVELINQKIKEIKKELTIENCNKP